MDAPAIRTRALQRSFGDTIAVAGVDLDLPAGSILGLLGPDGAGKSTLIRMLATVLAPSGGTAEVFGADVNTQAAAVTPQIGYMSQRFSMYPDLSVAENLDFFATIRGVGRAERAARASALLESMGLAEFAGRQAHALSGGMKQKLMLAATLMHEPRLLLLDEPTTGVDPVSRREFWRILADLHAAGKTVLVATPYMDEAERCTQLVFLDAGRVTRSGSPEQIKAEVPGRLFEVHAPNPRAAMAMIADLPGVRSAHLFGDVARVLWDAAGDPAPAVQAALAPAAVRINQAPMDMESAFAFLAEAEEVAS